MNPNRTNYYDHRALWTDERIDVLRTLWLGHRSAAFIAKALGPQFTRNAVIGRVHRLGLPGRAPRRGPGRKPKVTAITLPKPKPKPQRSPAPQRPKSDVSLPPVALPKPRASDPPPSERVSLLAITNAQCRSPLGDIGEPEFGFCGREIRPGSAYCPEHHARVWVPAAGQKRRAKKELSDLALALKMERAA